MRQILTSVNYKAPEWRNLTVYGTCGVDIGKQRSSDAALVEYIRGATRVAKKVSKYIRRIFASYIHSEKKTP